MSTLPTAGPAWHRPARGGRGGGRGSDAELMPMVRVGGARRISAVHWSSRARR